MYEIAIVVLLLIAIAMVALILVQQGKGAGMGASFGAGASNTVFGSVGSGNFLTRSTWFLILAFFGVCLFIGWLQTNQDRQSGDFSNLEEGAAQTQTVNTQSATDAPAVGATDAPVINDSGASSGNTDAPATDAPATK